MVPEVDGAAQQAIDDAQAALFRENGLLVVRNLLLPDELEILRRETATLVQRALDRRREPEPDFCYKRHELTDEVTPYRVEYVVDKSDGCKALLAHPFVLRSVEKLQGPSFVPTWDSLVFKTPGAGAAVAWHRDGGAAQPASAVPIFNVDFYLDEADETNCLWSVPGSNRWTADEAQAAIDRLGAERFGVDGATPLPMQPGDVLFHDVLVLHGSAPTQSPLRRVIYFEFRPIETELAIGPHTSDYIALKQRVLHACLRDRAAAPYVRHEAPYRYRPEPRFARSPLELDDDLETYRYPHEDYWRGA